MNEEKKHIEYTGSDILNYFAGRLNAAEMHTMEKAALDDPFLAEAMEGYSSLPAEELKTRLATLQNNFAGQQEPKIIALNPRKKSSTWKVAAAVIVLCTGLAVTYLLSNKKQESDHSLAKVEKVAAPETNLPAPQDSISTTAITSPLPKKEPLPKQVTIRPEEVATDTQFIYRPAPSQKDKETDLAGGGYVDDARTKKAEVAASNNARELSMKNDVRNAQPAAAAQREPVSLESRSERAAPLLTFNGQVLAADNTPLPFANVRIAGDQGGTYADARGNFQLVSPDSLLEVEIKSAGFITRSFRLKVDEMPGKIFLVPDDVALKDKTVISGKAYSVNRARRAVLQADTVMDARPADGWQNYDAYVTNNLEISNNIRQQKIHGEVEVSFDVQNTGSITNLKIDKSLCNDCDEEVLRLLKDGPKWKVTRGKTAKGKLRVKF